MLDPETRQLLTDVLRPPDGFAVEVAVATTYTLDLESLLLAPFAMAAYDAAIALDGPDPLALLESVRRHAEHTTVFVQAGGIHVPRNYPRLAAFAEDCVAEILPPAPNRVFHPKVWLLRFRSADGDYRHRFACLSRNLTTDRSWDTVLTCDEVPDGDPTPLLDSAPLTVFLRDLTNLTHRPLQPSRRAQIEDLATTLASARLAFPAPFTAGAVLPLGTPSGGAWLLPAEADDVTVVSPFLDTTALARLPRTGQLHLVTRAETLDRLGTAALPPNTSTWVLAPDADTPRDADQPDDAPAAESPSGTTLRGLHAKVLAWDTGHTGHVLTGSANCTSAAFNGNIELAVVLSGPVAKVGAKALLGDDDGLRRVLEPHIPVSDDPVVDPREALEHKIEAFHARLAAANLRLEAVPDGDRFGLVFSVGQVPDPVGTSTVRPIATAVAAARPLDGDNLRWQGIGVASLSPYVVVQTRLTRDKVTVERGCVLRAAVVGVPSDRSAQVLRDLLADEAQLMRYLALLLADPSLDAMLTGLLEQDGGAETGPGQRSRPSFDDVVLLEPLVRAAARESTALDRVHSTLDELRGADGKVPHLSEAFQELWDVVWAAREDA
jgi:hypothetical protein